MNIFVCSECGFVKDQLACWCKICGDTGPFKIRYIEAQKLPVADKPLPNIPVYV